MVYTDIKESKAGVKQKYSQNRMTISTHLITDLRGSDKEAKNRKAKSKKQKQEKRKTEKDISDDSDWSMRKKFWN